MYKLFFSIFLSLLVGFSTLNAQTREEGSVNVNGMAFSGEITINHNKKTITREADGSKRTFTFAEVSSVTIEGQNYEVQETSNSGYALLAEVVAGNAVLSRDPEEGIYLETESTDLRKLDLQNIRRLRGELLLYFSDCVPVRNQINKLSRIHSKTVIELSEQYNNCNYTEGFVLSGEDLRKIESNVPDLFNFYLGTGFYSNSLQLEPGGNKNALGGLLLNAGIKMSPGILRAVNNNLYLTANIDYFVKTEGSFGTSTENEGVTISPSAFKVLGGLHYAFGNSNSWQPNIGVKAGFQSSSYDIAYYNPEEDSELLTPVSATVVNPNFVVEPEIGITYELNEKSAFNLSLSYFLKRDTQFSSSETSTIWISTEETGFSVSLRYLFL